MNRRQFIQYSAASGTFILSLGLATPQKADAFLFLLLRGTLIDFALGALAQGAFALARSAFAQRTQEWYDKRLDAQLAQSEFLKRRFTHVETAQVPDQQYRYISATQFQEPLGYNVALSFPNAEQADASSYAGPATIGMAVAANYLRKNHNMSPRDIQAAVLPREKRVDSWRSWSEDSSFVVYANRASDNGVLIRYDSISPRPGGYGIIDVTVNSYERIRIPSIRVDYSK